MLSRIWLSSVALLAVLIGACGGGSGSVGGQTITLYNGQHPQTTAELVSAFEKSTGIQVSVRSGDEDVLANQIVQEGSRSPADVFFAENSPALELLQEKELLSSVAPSTLGAVPARYDSPNGHWVGVSARASGVVYNATLLSNAQLPRSVMDLAGPRWSGKLGLAPGETDFLPVVASVARAYGQTVALRWLDGLKANAGSHTYQTNEALISAVNSGQVAIGIIDNYYWYRLDYELGSRHMHSVFTYFSPADAGYVVDVSGAAVLSSSPHQAAAQRFLEFLVSKTGEEIIARSQSFEYPLGSGVITAQPLRPFAQLQPAPLTVADLGDGSTALTLLQKAQLL